MVVSAFNSRTREVEAEAGGEFKTNLVYKLKFQTARTVSGVGWVGWKKPVLTPPRHMAKFCNTKYRKEEVLPSCWGPRQNEAIQEEDEDGGGKMTNLLLIAASLQNFTSQCPLGSLYHLLKPTCLQQQNTRSGID